MKSISKDKRFFILILATVLSLVSCEDSFGIEIRLGSGETIFVHSVNPDNVRKDEDILLANLRGRYQIAGLLDENGVLTLRFGNNQTARFSDQLYPIIRPEGDKWTVSGFPTETAIRHGENGEPILPSISIEDGFWSLDGCPTDFSAEVYQVLLENGEEPSAIKGVLSFEDHVFIYLSDDTACHLRVIKEGFYRVPDYWMDQLVGKELLTESAIREADGDCSAFVFFTDSHWGKNMKKSPALIRHIIDYTPVDDVLFGGDVITSHSSNLTEPMALGKDFQSSFAFLGTAFHCLYGNHDNNSDAQSGKPEYHLSEEQVYSWLQSQMTDVVYGDFYNYYYDNPVTKTRIICLDTGRFYYSKFRDKVTDTMSFAIKALTTLPDGWHAIMASHIWCLSKKQSDGTYKQYIDTFFSSVLNVFDDYNARLSGVFTYKKDAVSYDFSSAGGKIEFCIGGHTHTDYTTASEKGIPVIIVTADCLEGAQPGTDKEQSVTMVVTDYKNRKLSMFVVGRGNDRVIDLR